MFAHKLVTLLDMEIKKALECMPPANQIATSVVNKAYPKGLSPEERAGVSNWSFSLKEGKGGKEHITFSVMMPKTIDQLILKLGELNAPREIVYPKNGGTYVSGDGSCSNYDASVTLLYNHFCFVKHNERLEEDLNLLKRKLVLLRAFLPKEPTTFDECFAADRYVSTRPDLQSNTYLGAVLQVWTEFTSLSKVIIPKFSEPISSWLPQAEEGPVPYIELLHRLPNGLRSVERILQVVEERTRGPIRALSYAVAKEFGLIIPSLQNMAFEKAPMKGNAWLTLVRQWRKDGVIPRLAAGTATTIVERSEVLLKSIRKANKYWWAIVSSVDSSHGSTGGLIGSSSGLDRDG
jgi:hypothetical protein